MKIKKARCQEWIPLIENYKASGLTMAAWCSANQFTLHTLKYWLRKLNGVSSTSSTKSQPSAFIPLSVGDAVSVKAHTTPLIVRVGEASIELRSDFDSRLFREVVQVLRSTC
ncbi:IS66 family insertion sequence element accessory protein TnpB [Paenibacillus sp. V4I7]|uniref:IS66 family insertion sequence element accessory protein TnpA n=1 Tax=Paenibacillus sp. V4I7 TaxID=3042307 RepID=UPI00277F9A8C|nr:IS66 family insertion sequence element accessory protein TnpB [Paenibacillus sp. V4I7]MDQ0897479.1 hypothetical protein [Paenibacillus sp. V4I7]